MSDGNGVCFRGHSPAEWLEYGLLRGTVLGAKIMPKRLVYAGFDLLARMAYRLMRRRRELAVSNLQRAFPQKSQEEIRRIARQSFRSLGRTFAEIVMVEAGSLRPETLLSNGEKARQAMGRLKEWESQGRGVIVIAAHHANWELGAQLFALSGVPLMVVGREGNNALVEERFIRPMRERFGNRAIGKNGRPWR